MSNQSLLNNSNAFVFFAFSAFATQDHSMLKREGDGLLDCTALETEFFAEGLGSNASSHRTHTKLPQIEKQCWETPKISLSIGTSKSFN